MQDIFFLVILVSVNLCFVYKIFLDTNRYRHLSKKSKKKQKSRIILKKQTNKTFHVVKNKHKIE